MECNRWEEEGLLYTSGELSEVQAAQYKAHMSECSLCKREFDEYTELIATAIGDSYPLEEISEECDERIKASINSAFESNRKPTFILGMSWVTLLRRSTVALVVVALSYFVTLQLAPDENIGTNIASQDVNTIEINDSLKRDSLKNFQEGDSKGIKSVNVREE